MTNDLTRGSPAKQILFFTIPLLIGNLFQQFYSMADTMIVGRTIGVEALAAVGATGSISFLIIGFSQGLTSGFAVITAQRFGAGDMDGVRKSVTSGILLGAGITVILTAVSVPLARPVLELMQTPEDILDDAHAYIAVIFAGIGASVMFNLLSNIIRALGDSRTPLLFLAAACAQYRSGFRAHPVVFDGGGRRGSSDSFFAAGVRRALSPLHVPAFSCAAPAAAGLDPGAENAPK